MVEDTGFTETRAKILKRLRMSDIDPPIRDIVLAFRSLPYCVTVQSCHGHLLKPGTGSGQGMYQIAYLALVIERTAQGRQLLKGPADIARLDTAFIQLGSAEWFWNDRGLRNSYVIQAEPLRFRHLDRFYMGPPEAVKWGAARTLLFQEVRRLLKNA